MRHLLRFFAVLTWDWFACRGERAANSERPTVFDAHRLDPLAVAELTVDEDTPLHEPDEPMGLGAVVEDASGDLWTSVTNKGASDRWQPNNLRSDCERRDYADIAAVRVLSEGVQP